MLKGQSGYSVERARIERGRGRGVGRRQESLWDSGDWRRDMEHRQ